MTSHKVIRDPSTDFSSRNIRNIHKKLAASTKADAVIAENPGVALDDLVASKKLNADQKALVEFMVSQALQDNSMQQSATSNDRHASDDKQDAGNGDNKDEETESTDSVVQHSDKDGKMTRNVFEQNNKQSGDGDVQRGGTLTHAQMGELSTKVFDDMKRGSNFKDAVLAHVDEYGITNIDLLFPDAQKIDSTPEWITRRMEWVDDGRGDDCPGDPEAVHIFGRHRAGAG